MSMTIKRVVNGVEMEFTLTNEEIREAYQIEQSKLDVDDVEVIYEGIFTPEQLEEIAEKKRQYQDEYAMSWRDAVEDAVTDCGYRFLVHEYERRV